MKYYVTNPQNGSDIKVGKISLKVGETEEYKKSDAEYLIRTFGFLNLRKEEVKEPTKPKKKTTKKEK